MRIETMIYYYGAVCICMILFNCICVFFFKGEDRRVTRKSRRFESALSGQLERIRAGEHPDEAYLHHLGKRLRKAGNLMAFDAMLSQLQESDPALAARCLAEMHPVFVTLTEDYVKKDAVRAAYLLYILAKYKVCRNRPEDPILSVLPRYLRKNSLYCRQNALQALYAFGFAENVIEAVRIIDKGKVFFHGKILTEGLLQFEGDHERLISLFWEAFETFTNGTQVVILNYIRFRSGNYQEKMYELLVDENRDQEVRLAAIRYFGKYPDASAFSWLLHFVQDPAEARWSYAAVSASALVADPGEKTVAVLKDVLHSSNWYVRYNAAQSLDLLGVEYYELGDIMSGNDRYAREMMAYRFSARKLREELSEDPEEQVVYQ